ncbi:hypothetical protein [Rhodohalobacter sp.]|uniref:hypothetical protein n=1 Tax=Rhodohalobacter sp. TaxID=1974210 RepID=UPI003564C367
MILKIIFYIIISIFAFQSESVEIDLNKNVENECNQEITLNQEMMESSGSWSGECSSYPNCNNPYGSCGSDGAPYGTESCLLVCVNGYWVYCDGGCEEGCEVEG